MGPSTNPGSARPPDAANPATLPLWAIPLLPLGVVGFFLFVSFVLGTVSGWRRLAAKFPAPKGTEGPGIDFCSASFDFGVSYNNCLTLEAAEHGLIVRVIPPFSFTHPPLLLPWETLRTEATRDKAFQPPSAGAAVDTTPQSSTFPARFTSAGYTHDGRSDSVSQPSV